MQKNVIITLVFALFIAIFAVMNAGKVPVNLIFTEIQLSAALVILISAFLGAIIVYSLDAFAKIKMKKAFAELELKVEALQKQNDLLSGGKNKKIDNTTKEKNKKVLPAEEELPIEKK